MLNKKKILVCFGTRPEAIKLAPVIKEISGREAFEVKVVVTSQHRKMLDQALELFEIVPDYDLNVMTPMQTLGSLTSTILLTMSDVLSTEKPDCIMVQGDTTTTFAVSLAAFYQRIPVIHVEAGLRTYQKFSPFPEEINRQMTSCLSDWHFPPTARSRKALLKENIPGERVFVVGNTVIDALLNIVPKTQSYDAVFRQQLNMIDFNKRMVLVTGHRRENFGHGFMNICYAIQRLAKANPEVEIVYPVHLNPNVQTPVKKLLTGLSNVHLIAPQDYLAFVWLLDRCYLVLTDSGGVQEEAPSLGKPVLVMRETTERPEAVEAGVACLVGTDTERIASKVQQLLDDKIVYREMARAQNPYGDGKSSWRIAEVLEKVLDPNGKSYDANFELFEFSSRTDKLLVKEKLSAVSGG